MRRSLRSVTALGVGALGVAAVVAGSVVAQDEEQAGEPRVIAPEECQVEPRPADEVVALIAPAEGGQVPTTAPRAPLAVPLGEPAGGGVVDEVTATTRELLACLNAGDVARTAAVMTDNGFRRLYGTGQANADALGERLAGTPTALPEERRTRLIAVTDVSRVPGGRVVTFVVINDPTDLPRGPETLLLTFDRVEDRWLVDDILPFSVEQAGPAGTPAAGTPAAE